jgi:hypothetical protein
MQGLFVLSCGALAHNKVGYAPIVRQCAELDFATRVKHTYEK